MMRKFIPVEEVAKEWFKDPEFRAAYDALEDEFALIEALIRARAHADMTQEDVAKAMGTTQAAIARLESGRSMPSTRTLERFAKATGTKLRISFAPDKAVSARNAKVKDASGVGRRRNARRAA
jgi:ribosome-binding protein aMBF1 (putative translation factor)